jgi:hemerythrin-like domain-containing protein
MISEMVKAHLENVKSLIKDLETQKQNIDNEINKLYSYIERGTVELNNFENSVTKKVVTDSSGNEVNKYYLGE